MGTLRIAWEEGRAGHYGLTEWEVNPAKTALVILDMQRGYVHADLGFGAILKQYDSTAHHYYYSSLAKTVIPNTLKLRSFFRESKLNVVYTRMGQQLAGSRDLPPWNWRRSPSSNIESCLPLRGSEEYELIEELTPAPSEYVVDKNSSSPFASVGLDQVLRNMGVENLVIAGVLTGVAVESTARDGSDYGYNVIVAQDACAAFNQGEHEDALARASWWVPRTTEQAISFLTGNHV